MRSLFRSFLRPALARARYILGGGRIASKSPVSARLCLDWLCRAQDVTGTGGFSAYYSLLDGWAPPYPETTGYIIPSLLVCADHFRDPELISRAFKAGKWLCAVQFENGALCSKYYRPENNTPSVFNTGMGTHGWVSLFESCEDEYFLGAAHRAADWLVSEQESDGSWIKNAYNGIPHTYYTMVDWALLRLYRVTQRESYRTAAIRNLRWVLSRQAENGWFDHSGFSDDAPVTTHTLSYITQGMVESGLLLEASEFVDAARTATTPLRNVFRRLGKLPGTFSSIWEPTASWECLTGNAQTAIVWATLSKIYPEETWLRDAQALARSVLGCQKTSSRDPGIDGAIPGSWPIGGGYDPFAFPNHAAKFFLDALLASRLLDPSADPN